MGEAITIGEIFEIKVATGEPATHLLPYGLGIFALEYGIKQFIRIQYIFFRVCHRYHRPNHTDDA